MTAAVAPAASALPHPERAISLPSVTTTVLHGSADTLTGASHREHRRPHLVPVPNCEPPFDDELEATDRGRARRRTEDFGALMAQSPATAARQRASQPLPVQTLQAPTQPAEGSTQDPAIVVARPGQPPTRQTRKPPHPPRGTRRDRAAPLGRTAAGTGIALAPPPTNRPTTITSRGVPSWSSEADIGVQRTASEHLPPADRAARVLARALVEILSGQRPVAQLRVHCAPEIYAGLLERPFTGQQALPHILTVRVCEPADGVAEVSAAFRRAERVRAVAFRIEGVDGRWRITALQVG